MRLDSTTANSRDRLERTCVSLDVPPHEFGYTYRASGPRLDTASGVSRCRRLSAARRPEPWCPTTTNSLEQEARISSRYRAGGALQGIGPLKKDRRTGVLPGCGAGLSDWSLPVRRRGAAPIVLAPPGQGRFDGFAGVRVEVAAFGERGGQAVGVGGVEGGFVVGMVAVAEPQDAGLARDGLCDFGTFGLGQRPVDVGRDLRGNRVGTTML